MSLLLGRSSLRHSWHRRLLRQLRCVVALFATACRYFTRIPCPGAGQYRPQRHRRSLPYLPWIGIVVGTLAALPILLLTPLGASPSLAALAAVAVHLLLTGAFHEDGLADTLDALGNGYDTIRTLAILKDPHLGTFGVVALWLALTAQWVALTDLLKSAGVLAAVKALIVAHSLARLAILIPMNRLPYLRSMEASAKAAPFSAPRFTRCEWGIAIAAPLIPLLTLPVGVTFVLLTLTLLLILFGTSLMRQRFGGYTGDFLGALETTLFTVGLIGIQLTWNST
ncbi:MAG: adenosylcobinamide-GDP ribazoletransferase [Hydrogenophilus sp.]|nr:adenosylcobinamide-GDP ribazoletransferase [Hydrogenophilus sp.]